MGGRWDVVKLYKKFTSRESEGQQTMSAPRYGMGLREWSIVGALVVVELGVVVLSARWVISAL